jgi:hypothetical protein
MPTKNEYHLPCFIFWNNIREELNKFLAENDNYISVSSFYFSVVYFIYLIYINQIRRKYFSKVKAFKYIKQRKYDKYLELKEKWEKAISNAKCLQIRAELAKGFISFEFKIFSTMMSK